MKKITSYFLLLFTVALFGSNNPCRLLTGKYTKEKKIHKTFNVNSSASLNIDNKYGDISIMTYSGSEIIIDIIIKTNGNDEEKVIDKLKQINIEFKGNKDYVEAKTVFNTRNSYSWMSWFKSSSKVKMQIDYVVNIPITNHIDISNDYGGIYIEKLKGNAKISCDYGSITSRELLSDQNEIRFDYSTGNFEYINEADVYADYSSLIISKANYIDLKADYSKTKINYIENFDFNCDFGAINIDHVNTINGNGDYVSIRSKYIYQSGRFESDFGSLKIDELGKELKSLDIASDYTGIVLGLNPDNTFNFDINLSYASLKGKELLNIKEENSKSNSKTYIGCFNSCNSSNLISIKSDFGGVAFKKI